MLWLWKRKTTHCFCLPGGVFRSFTLLCIFISVTYQFCQLCLFWCPPVHGLPSSPVLFTMNSDTCRKGRKSHKATQVAGHFAERKGRYYLKVVRDESKNCGVAREKGLCCLEYLLGSGVTWALIYSGIALVRSITNTSSKYNSVFEELSFAFFL